MSRLCAGGAGAVRSIRRLALLVFGTILTLNCASIPYYGRAQITPGPAVNGGIGVSTGLGASGSPPVGIGPITLPYYDYYCNIIGIVRFTWGFSKNAELVLQGAGGTGWWLTKPPEPPATRYSPILYDVLLGGKIRASNRSAIQMNLDFPGLFDIYYIYDFNRHFTGTAGLGFRGLSLGLTANFPLSEKLCLYCAGNATTGWEWTFKKRLPPALSAGIGLGSNL